MTSYASLDLPGKIHDGIQFDGQRFMASILRDSEFRFCSLRRVEFHECDLSFCYFFKCDLRKITFHGCDISRVRFSVCKASGGQVVDCYGSELDLNGAQGLELMSSITENMNTSDSQGDQLISKEMATIEPPMPLPPNYLLRKVRGVLDEFAGNAYLAVGATELGTRNQAIVRAQSAIDDVENLCHEEAFPGEIAPEIMHRISELRNIWPTINSKTLVVELVRKVAETQMLLVRRTT